MPEKRTLEAVQKDKAQGKSPSTQAGEFVKEEMHHIREGKHGAQSSKQAIAIGLSKARRAGVKLKPRPGTSDARLSRQAEQGRRKPSRTRSRATSGALKREPRSAASKRALSRQTRSSAAKRGSAARSKAAQRAVRTKGPRVLRQEARKASRTRKRAA